MMEPIRYVTYTSTGALDGCFLQTPPAEHLACMIVVEETVATDWPHYRANEARDGVEFAPPVQVQPAVPEEISPRQFRQALNKFGFRQRVDAAIAASTDQDLKDWYEFTSAFQRHHPQVLAMAPQLGFSDSDMDQVWIYGASLP